MSTSAVTYQCCLHFNGEDLIPFYPLLFIFLKYYRLSIPAVLLPREVLDR